ncbi:glycosyl hydrolase 115 family protein [Neobacillus drentensis]|uniref:glycosyl hydrolase 115 family protein n=1 Tax=Neobacillus drentensis TaxID=220684 RepID=UPI001F235460|nr:glycosyl hydrolase 115 family protein [Neobacillus drentensis]ULT58192.1 glycosyl hydrolase 115 family protein [Neobacillus drentensis]
MFNYSYVLIDKSTVVFPPVNITTPVQYALDMIVRDHKRIFGKPPKLTSSLEEAPDLVIRYASKEDDCPEWPEGYCFRFHLQNGKPVMHIIGNDDLGIIYGLLHYSKDYLGIDPFWFWADLPIQQKTEIKIPFKNFNSHKSKVKYRGWFVNDEVCLIGWKEEYPPTKEVWYPVFEALLRCGGNMVIPGTDLPRHGIHAELASEMGLWLTHHHAEPLGAEMFLRAYPGKQPNYQDNPELFENLWKEAVEKQKHQKIIWVLSFRGQGDAPFWQYAPEFDTPEKRGDMISKVVARQYELIQQSVEQPVCSMALYGEIAELYKEGHINVPEGVIYIWADNGYGKMVSRRQGNENLRIPSLPTADDPDEHGIYYHITFHDLQASNHLTMFPSPPGMIIEEVEKAFEAGADSYLLLNSGNIRPHLYPLDLISELWSKGTVNQEKHLERFIKRLYQTGNKQIEQLYQSYFNQSILYGENKDDRAGEEFYHHPARKIIGHWLQGKVDIPLSKLFWATGEIPFEEQVLWFKNKCKDGLRGWEELLQQCRNLSAEIGVEDQQRFYDQFTLHVELHVSGCKGFIALCNAYFHYKKQEYAVAFVRVSQSIRHYNDSILALKRAEQGKWENFYRADWLTNVKSTQYSLDALRKFIRMRGDSPDFFLWYKDFLMPETEKYIYLENTHRNPLSDDELSNRLEELFIRSNNK